MKIGSVDGTKGWGRELWASLADGGVWGVPRCGLIYQKDEPEKRLVLVQRMPWFAELSVTAEELRERQDYDHQRITQMMYAVGIEVIEMSDERYTVGDLHRKLSELMERAPDSADWPLIINAWSWEDGDTLTYVTNAAAINAFLPDGEGGPDITRDGLVFQIEGFFGPEDGDA